MTINLYTELIREADSRDMEGARRLIGYSLRLCAFYKGADSDVVLAAAALRDRSEDDIREILSRAEWPEAKIDLTSDCASLISTAQKSGFSQAGEGNIVYRSDAVENTRKGLRKEYNTPSALEHSGKNDKLTLKFSTVSTEFSTGEEPNGASYIPLEGKILLDADKLCRRGVYAEAEYIRSGGGKKSASITDLAFDTAQRNDPFPDFYTRQAKQICRELDRSADVYRRLLASECGSLDDELERFETGSVTEEPIYHRLALSRADSGFSCAGYCVWGGSVVKYKDRYHMLAARWRDHLGFPDGFITGSEIIHAVSDSPVGPFRYTNTVLSIRQRGKWDGQMSCDPQIIRIRDLKGDLFLMYYTGAPGPDKTRRRISAASARSPEGPWKRPDDPITLSYDPGECFAPAPVQARDGSILLAFSHSDGKIGIARAKRWDGEYEIIDPDILPGKKAGDPFLYIDGGGYRMIVSDIGGKLTGKPGHGAALTSDDGAKWRPAPYPRVYDNTLMYGDMSITEADKRARPFLLLEGGHPAALYTAACIGGVTRITAQEINDR